mgnify:CR=1 FL=1
MRRAGAIVAAGGRGERRQPFDGPTPISILTQHGEAPVPRVGEVKPDAHVSPAFEGSAERYLPGDPDAQYLYAIKVARRCDEADKPYCMEVKQPDFKDKNGVPYACELGDFMTGENVHTWTLDEQEMFFLHALCDYAAIANLQAAYGYVFGQGMWTIVGSIVAFLIGQLIDVAIFHRIRARTGAGAAWQYAQFDWNTISPSCSCGASPASGRTSSRRR